MPHANSESMQEFLDRFAATIDRDENTVMILDRAGWHRSGGLRMPDNITLVPDHPAAGCPPIRPSSPR